jgi:hypothetical protein
MHTSPHALTGRPRAAWKPWLLALVVLGIVGMHGLVLGGGTTAAHHASSPAPLTSTVLDEAGPDAGHHTGPLTAATGDHDDETDAGALALCMALLLALAVGVAGARRTTWVSLLDRLDPRQALPDAPLLRDSTPVPRFTVMRC